MQQKLNVPCDDLHDHHTRECHILMLFRKIAEVGASRLLSTLESEKSEKMGCAAVIDQDKH